MELDLSMYKEGYRNIAMQINELNNNSEAEIERLEGVIAENQAQIRNWDEPYEYYNYPESRQITEYNKDFENYARPFNEEIRKAQNRIAELQSSMEENQEQMKQNKEKTGKKPVLAPYHSALAPNLIGCCSFIGPVPPLLFIRFHI